MLASQTVCLASFGHDISSLPSGEFRQILTSRHLDSEGQRYCETEFFRKTKKHFPAELRFYSLLTINKKTFGKICAVDIFWLLMQCYMRLIFATGRGTGLCWTKKTINHLTFKPVCM